MKGLRQKVKLPRGRVVSFQIERDILQLAREQSSTRRIPLSMWFREAAREKLAALKERNGKAVPA